MQGRLSFWLFALLLIALGLAFMVGRRPAPERAATRPTETATPAPESFSTIAESGEILGVGIGLTLEEARAKLEPHRDPATNEVTEKKAPGRRKTQWKLKHPQYASINVKPDKDGRIAQVSVHVRPENPKPLGEIGELAQATRHQEGVAAWSIQRPDNRGFRLVASGPDGHATSITMTSIMIDEK